MKIKLTHYVRKYRSQPGKLLTALSSLTRIELLRELVDLVSAGEIRLGGRGKDGKSSLCERFYRYHSANPDVAEWFISAAQLLRREEHLERYSIGALFEKIRWDVRIGIIKADGLRIPNDFQSCYARLVLMRDPNLCGLFELRRISNADALVVDSCRWTDFAIEHEAELWPERAPRKKPANVAQAELALRETV